MKNNEQNVGTHFQKCQPAKIKSYPIQEGNGKQPRFSPTPNILQNAGVFQNNRFGDG